MFLEDMATVPFVDVKEGTGDRGRRSGVVEHLFEILGGGDVGGGKHQ